MPDWDADAGGLERIVDGSGLVRVPAGQPVFTAGGSCEQYLVVVSGSVRVTLLTESGREVVLYRVGPGQSCVLTTSCIAAGESYPADGCTETEVEAIALPRPVFEQAMAASAVFRRFVLDGFARRLAQLIQRMDEVAYGSLDARLVHLLVGGGPRLAITHEALATELGTAREVVTRRLKRYREKGWIDLHRGVIDVLDAEGLAASLEE